MNQDTEKFDSLRKLLALKRHEIPPPGYYDRLSRDIMARIKSGDQGEEMGLQGSWLRRLLGVFDVKPVFAGAFGTAVCAFLISGLISSEESAGMVSNAPANGDPALGELSTGMSTASAEAQYSASSNSMASGSLFDQFTLQATPVSDRFYFPSGN